MTTALDMNTLLLILTLTFKFKLGTSMYFYLELKNYGLNRHHFELYTQVYGHCASYEHMHFDLDLDLQGQMGSLVAIIPWVLRTMTYKSTVLND